MQLIPRAVTVLGLLAAAASVAPAANAANPRLLSGKALHFTTGVQAERSCAVRLARGAAVRRRAVTAPADGAVSVRTSGARGADWDVGLVDARTGRVLNGAAGAAAADHFEALVARGQRLRVQACRLSGRGGLNVRLRFARAGTGGGPAYRVRLVRVKLPTLLDRDRLAALGLDLADHAGERTWDVLLHSRAEEARLGRAGFQYTVRQADQLRHDRVNRAREASAQRRVVAARARGRVAQEASALPSGRASYRTLAEINDELRTLAQRNPTFTRLVTVGTSRFGKPIQGLEIARNVGDDGDGRPAYVMVGTHHAREWPANESTLEWAYELVNHVRGGGRDPYLEQIVRNARTVAIPVLNVDGFDVTTESEGLNPDGSYEDPVNTPGSSGDQGIGSGAYKRKTCADPDPALQAVPCLLRTSWHANPNPADEPSDYPDRGVDPNRNYGVEWGGPGTSSDTENLTFHGPRPFSEPETAAFSRWLRNRNPTVLISNHTYTGLILRPPGTSEFGPTPDEFRLRLLGDAMADQVDYISQYGYQLYDTTGTTDDYGYDALGAFSYTPEIGKEEFHPPYADVVGEYAGQGGLAGLRRSFTYAGLAAINTGQYSEVPNEGTGDLPALPRTHSVIQGTAPGGRYLKLTRTIRYRTSDRPNDDGVQNPPQTITEPRTLLLRVHGDGRFRWHVNPSSQPRSGEVTPWRLTCHASPNGPALESRNVYVALDQTVNVGLRCGAGSSGAPPASGPECVEAEGFRRVAVRRRRGGLRFIFSRQVRNPVNVDVFRQSSRGRVKLKKLRTFRKRTRSFTWRARGGKLSRDGVYVVRFRMRDATRRADWRRVVIERKGGTFSRRGKIEADDTCRT